ALAVARASAELSGRPTDVTELARAVERGRRSGVGTWTFAHGGFVLEGGRRDLAEHVAPLLARLPIPASWRCVLAVPKGSPGLAGDEEAAAFARLPSPNAREVEQVSHLVLMQLLPALAEADLEGFGAALGAVQRITGGWFAPAQGGGLGRGGRGERTAGWGGGGGEGAAKAPGGAAAWG